MGLPECDNIAADGLLGLVGHKRKATARQEQGAPVLTHKRRQQAQRMMQPLDFGASPAGIDDEWNAMRRKEIQSGALVKKRVTARREQTSLNVCHHHDVPCSSGRRFGTWVPPPDRSAAEHGPLFSSSSMLNSRKAGRPAVSGRDSILAPAAQDSRESVRPRFKIDSWSGRRRRFETPSSSDSW